MKNSGEQQMSRKGSQTGGRLDVFTENMKQMRRIDMHAHLFCISEADKILSGESLEITAVKELDFRRQQSIFTCFSAGTPEEWQFMEQWRERDEVLLSFGIHPWYADRYSVNNCRGYLEECDFIGEIGMDSVWCQVPLETQKRALEQQLQIAADLGKPVLLHTKGQEKEIGEIIKDFPGNVCVHWYSGGEKELEVYLEKDCYFTLGPDFAQVCRMGEKPFKQAADDDKVEKRQGYLRILKEIPVNRLFLETDGLSAVAWANGVKKAPMQEISQVLEANEAFLAEEKQMTAEALQRQMKKNLIEWEQLRN